MPKTAALPRNNLATHTELWPLVLVGLLLGALWTLMFDRAKHDDTLVVQEALVNHSNIARAVGNHTEQMLDRLRFYGRMLTQAGDGTATREVVRAALGEDKAFLRLMQFDADGRLLFSTGPRPESWLLEVAHAYAAEPRSGKGEEFRVGTVPHHAYAHAWSLPLFYRPGLGGPAGRGFILALVDLGNFQYRFEDMRLGKSGEIVLVAEDGLELLRLHQGRLDFVESIAGTTRHRLAFTAFEGEVTERVRDAHERLYAYRRVAASPIAVLVSRTRYDVLFENAANQRGYWLSALLMTLPMLLLTLMWFLAARRRKRLLHSLHLAQDENARLIGQLEKEKQAAYRLATHDKLTGLPNRMLFAEVAGRYVARAERVRGHFAVLFIDLDRFKPINDTHGHKAGDQLLVEVARRLEKCVRQTDLVSRFGGDEFVALLADLRGSHDAAAIAAKIIESLRHPFVDIVPVELFVTPSIGIALYPEDAEEIDALLRQADGAMYQAKAEGRATYVFADPSLNRRNDLRNQIVAALPLALKNREITLHYQAKVSLKDFSIVGMEALARWQHPQLGAVSPADFIPAAESSSLIVELGEYVIDSLCAQLALWQHAGLPLVPVAINVSPRQLRSARLYDFVEATLARHGIAPRFMEIEITETGLFDAGDDLTHLLRRLEGLGIKLAIDDFGTGFSGLSHLRALPAKYLKIDRSFIKDIRNEHNDAAIVSSMIGLAHNLSLRVIAEGVETREQLAHLRAAGCDQAQGYLFARPLPAEQVPKLLQQRILFVTEQE